MEKVCVSTIIIIIIIRFWDNSVGIATHYGENGPGIESRWGARISELVQTDHETHQVSYAMGTGSFPAVKWAGRGANNPPLSSVDVVNGLEIDLHLLPCLPA